MTWFFCCNTQKCFHLEIYFDQVKVRITVVLDTKFHAKRNLNLGPCGGCRARFWRSSSASGRQKHCYCASVVASLYYILHHSIIAWSFFFQAKKYHPEATIIRKSDKNYFAYFHNKRILSSTSYRINFDNFIIKTLIMFCTHHRNEECVRVLLHVVTDEDILGALRV